MSKARVCKVLEVSRASLYWKSKGERRRYKKKEDQLILKEIKAVLAQRPTYGYKRVTAMINRIYESRNLNKLNKKRIYRIMDMEGLIFKKRKKKKELKTGRIITDSSDRRWCSDIFEIKCWNGEKAYVVFALDCHDRECLAHIAKPGPVSARDIQDLMLLSLEKRFEDFEAPWEIEWLSDRGAVYRAFETVALGRRLGLKSCFTAAYSPESNGMAEAFVKTIKRDYVYVSDCYSAKQTIRLLKGWIEDYNSKAPHSGLGMMSPEEYRRKQAEEGTRPFSACDRVQAR